MTSIFGIPAMLTREAIQAALRHRGALNICVIQLDGQTFEPLTLKFLGYQPGEQQDDLNNGQYLFRPAQPVDVESEAVDLNQLPGIGPSRATATVSAVLIVKDEEDRLAACLDSVTDTVDEIIVLDTGSSDATMEIARRYTTNVHSSATFTAETPSEDFHFGDARNEAKAYCTSDWILSIDADEKYVGNGMLREYLAAAPRYVHCMWLSRPDGVCTPVPRLLPNTDDITWRYRCHELPTHGETVCCLPNTIATIAHTRDVLREENIGRNLRLLQRELKEIWVPGATPLDIVKVLHDLGRTHKELGQLGEAIGFLHIAWHLLQTPKGRTSPLYRAICTDLAHAFNEIGVYGPAIAFSKEAWDNEPHSYEAGAICASCHLQRLEYAEALPIVAELRGIVRGDSMCGEKAWKERTEWVDAKFRECMGALGCL